ncbi:MAG: helix-turn-helix domain-containing protein, partial [Balneolaceae bacterium]
EGAFREDLYYRLDTVKINLPPLRERSEDIIPIFRKFVTEYSAKYDSVFRGFSDEARELLVSYRWPGNIRELRNVAEQLVVLEKSQFVDRETLQKYLKGRQREGLPDNLPMLSGLQDPGDGNEEYSSGKGNEKEFIYRVLLELQNDMGDLKKMLGKFLYSTFSTKQIKALPPAVQRNIDPNELHTDYYSAPGAERGQSERAGKEEEKEQENAEDKSEFDLFFDNDRIPSIEETEQFLIEQALKRFNGNRRKASEVLGISERTLYRKLDQYNLV